MVREFIDRMRWGGNKRRDQRSENEGDSAAPEHASVEVSCEENDGPIPPKFSFSRAFDETRVQLIAEDCVNLTLNNGALTLPSLKLHIPSDTGPLHDIRLQISVTGGPEKLGGYVQAAYAAAVSQLKTPCSRTVEIRPQTTAPWDSQIKFDPAETVRFSLILHYRESDRSERVKGESCVVNCTIDVHPQSSLLSDFVTSVYPSLIRVFCGKLTGAPLEIIVRSRQGELSGNVVSRNPKSVASLPGINRLSQEWKLPRLRMRIEQMLAKICTHFVSDNKGGWYAKQVPVVEFDAQESEQIQRLAANGTVLRFTARISVEGSPSTEFCVQLLPDSNPFPGVVSIDLGTAGSTVVVNDPAVIDCPAVPVEQVARLKSELLKWLRRPAERPFPRVTESQWTEFLKSVAAAMNLQDRDVRGELERIVETSHISQSHEDRMFELVRQIELAVYRLPPRSQRHLQNSLYRLMSGVFEEFPLRMWHVRVLDFSNGDQTVGLTSSELEMMDIVPESVGAIGYETARRHEQWMRSGESDEAVGPRGRIRRGRFIRNPKSSLEFAHRQEENQYSVTLDDGAMRHLSPRDIIHAAFGSLLGTFEENRTRLGISNGPLNRVVVTYPASLLPEPREALVETLMHHGIRHVDKTFDEAVAPTIFYIEQRFSDAPEIGPEAFKTRCQRIGDLWYHQMLIIDVGAGTTDIALVQIEMRETRSRIEPANGGRIYTISPRLLGSTGRQHLGGNLISLLLFRRLKLELAEWLVRMSSTETGDRRRSSFEQLNLLNDDQELRAALEAAERVIPTQFRETLNVGQDPDGRHKAQTSSRFFAIWEIAETLKLEFSRLLSAEARPACLELEPLIRPRLSQILAGTQFERLQADQFSSFPVFSLETFSNLAGMVIAEITTLANKLTLEAIRRINGDQSNAAAKVGAFKVDSIVLSGRSCQLPLFREQIESAVQHGLQFSRNRTEVLYHEKYAKLATAIGALRGQRLVSLALTSPTSDELASGQSSRDLDIRNLFFFLPSTFQLGTQDGAFGTKLFEMHQQFRHHDFTSIGRLRTPWKGAPNNETLIYRTEGENQNASGRLWGQLVLVELAARIGIDVAKLRDGLQIRYEVTHELDLYALLRRQQTPDNNVLYAARESSTPPGLVSVTSQDIWQTLMKNDMQPKVLPFPIFVGEPKSVDSIPLIPAGTPFDFLCNTGTEESPTLQPALWSHQPLPPIAIREQVYHLYTRDPQTGKTLHLAHFDLEVLSASRSTAFSFESSYRLLVAVDGTLALFCGDEPSFWSTDKPEVWIRNQGQVLRYKLPRPEPADEVWRDPFSGHH